MKIVKRGHHQITCKRCGCIMEYDKHDIHEKLENVSRTDFLHQTELWKVELITCPQCGKEIEIERHLIY